MRTEPPFRHGTPHKTAVLLCNLGTPEAPNTAAVRRYLRQFLSDPRVIEIPKLLWMIILHGIILWTRPRKSAAKYASIWGPEGSPLLAIGKKQAQSLQHGFQQRRMSVYVHLAMRYAEPSIASALNHLRSKNYDRILVLPMYPQYAAATTASVFDAVCTWSKTVRNLPEFRFIKHYHDHPAYIYALAEHVRQYWLRCGKPNFGRGDLFLMSFHGVPEQTLLKGDPYHCECQKTGRLLAEALGLEKQHYRVTFQSRFGAAKWLRPYTDKTLESLGQTGMDRVDVFCPGFLTDCLETLEEINMEARETFTTAGGRDFHYIPCLNQGDLSAAMLTEIATQHLQGWPVDEAFEENSNKALMMTQQLAHSMGATDLRSVSK
jgi:ferrochelatase